jgi:hypothetical protein
MNRKGRKEPACRQAGAKGKVKMSFFEKQKNPSWRSLRSLRLKSFCDTF